MNRHRKIRVPVPLAGLALAAAEAALSDTMNDEGFKERVELRLSRVEAAMSRRISPSHCTICPACRSARSRRSATF